MLELKIQLFLSTIALTKDSFVTIIQELIFSLESILNISNDVFVLPVPVAISKIPTFTLKNLSTASC